MEELQRLVIQNFPNGIFFGCHLKLSKKDKNDENYIKILVDDYDPKKGKDLRYRTKIQFRICEVAKMPDNTYEWKLKKKLRWKYSY